MGGQICLVEIGVSRQICVVVNRCGWSDMRGWKYGLVVRSAWLEIGVGGQIRVVGNRGGGQICLVRNRCGWSDMGGWK